MRHPQIHSRGRRALGPVAALSLLLGGCAAAQQAPAATPPPAPAAPCVDPAHIPAEPPMVGSKFNGDAKHDLQVLARNARALRDWGEQLHTLLQACTPPAADAVAAKP